MPFCRRETVKQNKMLSSRKCSAQSKPLPTPAAQPANRLKDLSRSTRVQESRGHQPDYVADAPVGVRGGHEHRERKDRARRRSQLHRRGTLAVLYRSYLKNYTWYVRVGVYNARHAQLLIPKVRTVMYLQRLSYSHSTHFVSQARCVQRVYVRRLFWDPGTSTQQ